MSVAADSFDKRAARWGQALSIALLAAGIALRFFRLERQSLWDDEMYTWNIVRHSMGAYLSHLGQDGHPPLYSFQLKAWAAVFGSSVASLRANAAAWGSLGLWLFSVLMKRAATDVWERATGVALFAFSAFAIGYAQEMRSYTMSLTITLACCLILEKALTDTARSTRWRALAALASTIAWFTHYWAGFSTTSQFAGAAGSSKRTGRFGSWTLWAAVPSIFLLLWTPILVQQTHAVTSGSSFWVHPPGLANLALTFEAFTGTRFRFAAETFVLSESPILRALVIATFVVCFSAGLWRSPAVVVGWLIGGLGIPFLISFRTPAIYVWYRFPIVVYPAFLLMVARGAGAIRPAGARAAATVILVGSALAGVFRYETVWQKANVRAVASYAESVAPEGSLVIRPSYVANLFDTYYRGHATVRDESDFDSPAARAALRGRTVVLVNFDEPGDPVGTALRDALGVRSSRAFPAHSRLAITVYVLGPALTPAPS